MNALLKAVVTVLLAFVLAACGGAPKKAQIAEAVSRPTAAQTVTAESVSCPSTWDKNAIMKYGYPEEWERRTDREPPTVYSWYRCIPELTKWAKEASNREAEQGGCRVSHTSFDCESRRGPSGSGRIVDPNAVDGTGRPAAMGALQILRPCPNAVIERRRLRGSVDSRGQFRFRAEQECHY